MSDKANALQLEAKKAAARIEELTKEQADTSAKLSAAQGEVQKSEANATDLLAKLTAMTEERDKALKERDAAKAELEQLNQQVRIFFIILLPFVCPVIAI